MRVTYLLSVFQEAGENLHRPWKNMQTLHIRTLKPAGPTEAPPFIKYLLQLHSNQNSRWSSVRHHCLSPEPRLNSSQERRADGMVSILHSSFQNLTVFTPTSMTLGGARPQEQTRPAPTGIPVCRSLWLAG